MSLYRQAFWKLLELGIIPDYYVRSKVRNGLIDQIKDMNQDGNVETAQENLNKFIEEIKTMPIAINQSNHRIFSLFESGIVREMYTFL